MLSVNQISGDKEKVIELLSRRGFSDISLIDDVISADKRRREMQHQLDELLAESNAISKEIGMLYKSGNREEAELKKASSSELKERGQVLQAALSEVEDELRSALVKIPNIPNPLVPAGKSDEDNELVRTGQRSKVENKNVPHWDIAKEFNLFDLEDGVKIAGAGFPVYRGKGAKLQRALISFFLEEAIGAGYEEIIPPLLVNEETAFATGQLPDKEGQMYEMKEDPYFLIPTAEVPITNLLRDTIIGDWELPVKFCGYTPCFRREAGSYGKEVRGLNRVHQFDKVEIVRAEHPDNSYDALDEMVSYVESLLKALELPYRIMRLCGGDLGFTSALTYDFEVHSAGQDRWLEVSSVSNFESFQANRLKLRIKDKHNNKVMAHTLNGSALALPRIVATLLENNFDGERIHLPVVLHKYFGKSSIEK